MAVGLYIEAWKEIKSTAGRPDATTVYHVPNHSARKFTDQVRSLCGVIWSKFGRSMTK
jgi:hypothetical protein